MTKNPPQCNLCRMLAFPQNRVFLGFAVRLCLKNYWFIAQFELLAELVEKREAGSGKNNVGNTRHIRSQPPKFLCSNNIRNVVGGLFCSLPFPMLDT